MRYCCAHPAVAAYEVAWTDPPERIAEHVARAFAPDGVFVTPWLGRPVVGHEAISEHIAASRGRLAGTTVRHTSVMERVGNVLRWTRAFAADGQTVSSGMDVVVLAEDERIALLAAFDGPTPPSVGEEPGS